jgi:hypothetical protein
MTTYAWIEERERAIAKFNGDTPGAELEAAILTHFREHPGRVHTLVDAIGRRVTDGSVRSGWAILRSELDAKPADIQATDNAERAIHLRLAEQWIKNTGGYIDTQPELEDALFGDQGPLRQWPDLKPQIVDLWRKERPWFENTAHDEVQRQARQGETYRRLRRMTHTADPKERDAHALRIAAEVERARHAQERAEYFASLARDEDLA